MCFYNKVDRKLSSYVLGRLNILFCLICQCKRGPSEGLYVFLRERESCRVPVVPTNAIAGAVTWGSLQVACCHVLRAADGRPQF